MKLFLHWLYYVTLVYYMFVFIQHVKFVMCGQNNSSGILSKWSTDCGLKVSCVVMMLSNCKQMNSLKFCVKAPLNKFVLISTCLGCLTLTSCKAVIPTQNIPVNGKSESLQADICLPFTHCYTIQPFPSTDKKFTAVWLYACFLNYPTFHPITVI